MSPQAGRVPTSGPRGGNLYNKDRESIPPTWEATLKNVMLADFLYNPDNLGHHCHAATLAEAATGDLLASWYAYPAEEHRDANLVLARLPSGSASWEAPCVLPWAFGSSMGNPVLFVEPGGRIWLLFVTLQRYWTDVLITGASSSDGGRSWSVPVVLWREPGLMVRHPPVLREDGMFLLPAYRESEKQSLLLSAHPPYSQWREAYRFDDLPLIQPALVREGSGDLALFFRPTDEPRIVWRSRSTDDGRSWSSPIRTPLPTALAGIGAFATDGLIGVVYNHTRKHQRHPLSIAVSRDGGVTWTPPWHIDTIEHEVSYPSFLVDSRGRIHGVYTYNRRMIKYVVIDPDELP